ncbi:MAG: DUF5665 domain-containing protein [Patescibacteria group bacterium]
MPTKKHLKTDELTLELAKEVKSLSKNIRELESEKVFQIVSNPWRLMWYSFLKGLMVGFGSVLGATVMVGVFIYLLSQVEFVPIIGDWVTQILDQVKGVQ